MAIVISPVDNEGNISFNFDEGLIIPIGEVDPDGNSIDVSNALRFFNINHGALRVLVPEDPNNSNGKRLVLTPEQLRAVGGLGVFSYTDESGVVPVVIWEGKIYERN